MLYEVSVDLENSTANFTLKRGILGDVGTISSVDVVSAGKVLSVKTRVDRALMSSHVCQKVATLSERLVTGWKRALKWFFAGLLKESRQSI